MLAVTFAIEDIKFMDWDTLKSGHVAAWKQLWQGGVEVDDEELG